MAAAVTLLVSVLMLSSVRVGKSAEALFNLKCQRAVGAIGETTNIYCSIESQTGPVVVKTVVLTKFRENKPCFTFTPHENRVTGDPRFTVESSPSLQLHNTVMSDEGGYRYYIRTNQGNAEVDFKINVTAKYNTSVITSYPEEIENGGAADLYCRASGGYPAGTINWFDQSNTNWTRNSELQITRGNDGLFTLSSKLSFRSIDSNWGSFRCVVLNYRYEEEGGSSSTLKIKDDPSISKYSDTSKTSIIAAVLVIGSLIVGLLLVLVLRRRCSQRDSDAGGTVDEHQPALNEDVYKKAGDVEEKIEV